MTWFRFRRRTARHTQILSLTSLSQVNVPRVLEGWVGQILPFLPGLPEPSCYTKCLCRGNTVRSWWEQELIFVASLRGEYYSGYLHHHVWYVVDNLRSLSAEIEKGVWSYLHLHSSALFQPQQGHLRFQACKATEVSVVVVQVKSLHGPRLSRFLGIILYTCSRWSINNRIVLVMWKPRIYMAKMVQKCSQRSRVVCKRWW